jgi:hypothetical protein
LRITSDSLQVTNAMAPTRNVRGQMRSEARAVDEDGNALADRLELGTQAQ